MSERAGGWRHRAPARPPGLERFLDVYRDAGLLPYSPGDNRLMEALGGCVNCGNCLAVCPVVGAAVAHPYPGPRAVGAGLSRSLPEFWAARDIVGFCVACMACEEACPADVPVYRAVLAIRAKNFERWALEGRQPLEKVKQFAVDFFAGGRLAEAACWGAALQGLAFTKTAAGGMKARAPVGVGPLAGRVLPPLARRPLVAEFPSPVPGDDPRGPRVAVFAGCVSNYAYTDTGRALVSVLRRHSREVVLPAGQVCCGAPALYSGDLATSRRLALANAEAFKAAGADFVVTACATCGDVLAREYPPLREGSEGREVGREVSLVRALSARVRDVHAFLADEVEFRPPGPSASTRTVTIHDPCHLARGQGVRREVRDLARAVPGVKLCEMAEPGACCGGAGSFSLDHYEVADAIRRRKVADIDKTGAELVLTGCPSCRMHILEGLERAGKGRPVRHFVELLEEAYRVGQGKGGARS